MTMVAKTDVGWCHHYLSGVMLSSLGACQCRGFDCLCRYGVHVSRSGSCVLPVLLGSLPLTDALISVSSLRERVRMPTLIHCNCHNHVYKHNNIVW